MSWQTGSIAAALSVMLQQEVHESSSSSEATLGDCAAVNGVQGMALAGAVDVSGTAQREAETPAGVRDIQPCAADRSSSVGNGSRQEAHISMTAKARPEASEFRDNLQGPGTPAARPRKDRAGQDRHRKLQVPVDVSASALQQDVASLQCQVSLS